MYGACCFFDNSNREFHIMNAVASRHLPLLNQMYPGILLLDVDQIARCINWNPGSIYNLLSDSKLPFKVQKVGGKRCASILELADYLDSFLTSTDVHLESKVDSIVTAKKNGPGRPRGSTKARAEVQIFQAQLRAALCVAESTSAIHSIVAMVSATEIETSSSTCESEFALAKAILIAEVGTVFVRLQQSLSTLQSYEANDEGDDDLPSAPN